jgi:flagellar basal-body rod modification protein FlgD
MTTAVTNTTPNSATSGTTANNLSATSAADQSDRFLKLLVAQMQNQDPLNPLDNAQVTSQMAQISTVSGLDKVNTSVAGLGTQFVQLQAMQGASLVGHDVAIEGNTVRELNGKGDGGYELSSPADKVKVEISRPDGTVVATLDDSSVSAGRHDFNWDIPSGLQGTPLSFKVTATAGTTAVDAMALQHQSISAVSTFGNTLALELNNGTRVAYDAVWAFL